jgi:hypothetical protein
MKPQSKSKTFPKGTDFQEVADFITKQIETSESELGSHVYEDNCKLKAMYLITIVKHPEKEEK